MLSAFNYAQGVVQGVEFSAKFNSGNFQAYGNLAVGQEKATNVVSNQYLFDNATPLADLGGLTELQYCRQSLDLHRSHPACDRLGRRRLSILRPGFNIRRTVVELVVRNKILRRHDLRLGAAHRRRQYRFRSRPMRSSTPASRTNSPRRTVSR